MNRRSKKPSIEKIEIAAYHEARCSGKPFIQINSASPPENDNELFNRILIHKSFGKGLAKLEDMFTSEKSTSVIITGYPASGKTTMVRLAEFNTQSNVIYINSVSFSNDTSALHHILDQTGINRSSNMKKETISETMDAIIRNRKQFKTKFVVVLCDFDQFCRKSQLLLYNLTEMIQYGINMSLVGITSSRDCMENLEKRVRSRISASFIILDMPYRNTDEYIEFASNLLGSL